MLITHRAWAVCCPGSWLPHLRPAQALTGPWGGFSGTHSKPRLTCLPARVKIDVSTKATSAASTFSHLSSCQRSLCRARISELSPAAGPVEEPCCEAVKATLFLEVTLCSLLLARGLPCSPPGVFPFSSALCLSGFSVVCPLPCRMRDIVSPLQGQLHRQGDLCPGPRAEKTPSLVFCGHCLEIPHEF